MCYDISVMISVMILVISREVKILQVVSLCVESPFILIIKETNVNGGVPTSLTTPLLLHVYRSERVSSNMNNK